MKELQMIPLWLDAHDRAFAQIVSETNDEPMKPSTLLRRTVGGTALEFALQFRIVQNGELALPVMRGTMNK